MLWSGKQVGELLTLECVGTINGGRDWCRRYVEPIAVEVFETDQSCLYICLQALPWPQNSLQLQTALPSKVMEILYGTASISYHH